MSANLRRAFVCDALGVHRYDAEVNVWILSRAVRDIECSLAVGQHLALAALGVDKPHATGPGLVATFRRRAMHGRARAEFLASQRGKKLGDVIEQLEILGGVCQRAFGQPR
jgi:hypothetical protein